MPLDLSLQSPSAFLEENPRALIPPIRTGRGRHKSISPPPNKNNESARRGLSPKTVGPEVFLSSPQNQPSSRHININIPDVEPLLNKGPLNVGSWEWDSEYRHRTEKNQARNLNDKIQDDSKDLNVLSVLSKQLKETTVHDTAHEFADVANGDDEARRIIHNMSSVSDCLKLKQLRREERLMRRAADKDRQPGEGDAPTLPVPVPRKDLFTSEFRKEREDAKAVELKHLNMEQKHKELKKKEQKLAKAKRLLVSKSTLLSTTTSSSSSKRGLSPPKAVAFKEPSQVKGTAPNSGQFRLPEQVTSSRFPTPSRQILFSVSSSASSSGLPQPQATEVENRSFVMAGGAWEKDVLEVKNHPKYFAPLLPQMHKTVSTAATKTKQPHATKPTVAASKYVSKQQLWALQVEAKKVRARKENEERELRELRVVPDVTKAQESWGKLKQKEARKSDAGIELVVSVEGVEEGGAVLGEPGRDVSEAPEPVVHTISDDGVTGMSSLPDDQLALDSTTQGGEESNLLKGDAEDTSVSMYDTAVRDMTTVNDITGMLTHSNTEVIVEGVIEGEDGFEDDDEVNVVELGGSKGAGSAGAGAGNTSAVDAAGGAGTATSKSEFGYDEQFFATSSVVKTGSSLVLPDGAVIGGFAYEHPLQTNKDDSVYTTPASPLKKVVGDTDVSFDTDRFEDTERSTYDPPKGRFGREAASSTGKGAVYRWRSDEESDGEGEKRGVTGRAPDTTRDTARSDCSDYEDDWEFTGLPSNDNKTARGSEGVWLRKGI